LSGGGGLGDRFRTPLFQRAPRQRRQKQDFRKEKEKQKKKRKQMKQGNQNWILVDCCRKTPWGSIMIPLLAGIEIASIQIAMS
jgi:hypothetical protein